MVERKTRSKSKSEAKPAEPNSPQPLVSRERWLHPFRDMEREFDRFFGRSMLPFGREWPRWDEWFIAETAVPKVDVIDQDDEIIVRAEVPGMTKDDLDVSLTDQSLTIRGQKRSEEKEEKEGEYFRQEIRREEISRTVMLPSSVDPDKAKATCKDGLLELVLPKREVTKRQKLKIQS